MLNDVCYMNETDCHYEDSGDSDASGWKEFASLMEESAELGVCKRNTVRRDGVINEVDTKRLHASLRFVHRDRSLSPTRLMFVFQM